MPKESFPLIKRRELTSELAHVARLIFFFEAALKSSLFLSFNGGDQTVKSFIEFSKLWIHK